MSEISCRLIAHSTSDHVQQIYAGFFMLHRQGIIRLSQDIDRGGRWLTHVRAVLNDRVRLHYDTFDGGKINETYLNACDFYFKRSYSARSVADCGDQGKKVHPLGLYYWVQPHNIDKFALRRSLQLPGARAGRLRGFLRAIDPGNRLQFTPRTNVLQRPPEADVEPRVLFMVKAWDPDDDPKRPKERIEHRRNINEMRAQCIRLLRAELGARFYGGFQHTDFAKRHYGDLLVPDNRLTAKKAYLNLLRDFPVCVATTGLHDSMGAKFGEYVALSKAILSEKLNYEVPGPFQEGSNYLQFDTPAECVEGAVRLRSDADLRRQLMMANFRYYHAYLRPDSLVLNTLTTALAGG